MSDLEMIYISAARYAIGRRTYITGLTADFLIKQNLSEHCKSIIARDIEDAEKRNELGDNCDKESWLKLLNNLIHKK